MHYCNVQSKQFDEVIYLSADDIELGKCQTTTILALTALNIAGSTTPVH